jgi:uncharacterized protein
MVSAPSPDPRVPTRFAIQPLVRFGVQAWRNGGGITRPLASDRNGSWRISLADVTRAGPYSRFEGMARLSLIVSGAGVNLRNGSRTVALLPGQTAAYDGDTEWDAALNDGPVVALNAMATHGRHVARIMPLTDSQPHATAVPSGVFALVLTLGGRCAWSTGGDLAEPAYGTLDPTEVLTRDADGPSLYLGPLAAAHSNGLCAALVTIEPVHPSENPKQSKGIHA